MKVLPAALQKITWIGKKMKKKEEEEEGEENEVSRAAVQPMKAIIELLQKVLGETVPPVTSHFFIYGCATSSQMSQT